MSPHAPRHTPLCAALALALPALLAAAPALAQSGVPGTLAYQGYLEDAAGEPVQGPIDLTFALYDTPDAASPQWTETLRGVDVVDGVFVAWLGESEPLTGVVGDATARYLGIAVGADPEATPRQALASAPYALLAGDAARLGGQPAESYAPAADLVALQDRLAALEQAVAALPAGGGAGPHILGVTLETTTGRLEHAASGHVGLAGAHALCQAAYPAEPTAHLCTLDEVRRAVATRAWEAEAAFDEVDTWTVAPLVHGLTFGNSAYRNACEDLLYSGDELAKGAKLRVDLGRRADVSGPGELVGDTVEGVGDQACHSSYPLLCCR